MKGKYWSDEKSHRKDHIICRAAAAGQRGTQKCLIPHLLVHIMPLDRPAFWEPSGVSQCWLPGHLSLPGDAHVTLFSG